MCVGFQIWVLVGLDACTNCNKNKLAYVVKSMKYKDKRKKYQSEIISELLTLVTIHHIIYIYIYIYMRVCVRTCSCMSNLENYSIPFWMTTILPSMTLIMITMTQIQTSMKNSIKKETDRTNSIQHLLKIKICHPYPNMSTALSIINEAHITYYFINQNCL